MIVGGSVCVVLVIGVIFILAPNETPTSEATQAPPGQLPAGDEPLTDAEKASQDLVLFVLDDVAFGKSEFASRPIEGWKTIIVFEGKDLFPDPELHDFQTPYFEMKSSVWRYRFEPKDGNRVFYICRPYDQRDLPIGYLQSLSTKHNYTSDPIRRLPGMFRIDGTTTSREFKLVIEAALQLP